MRRSNAYEKKLPGGKILTNPPAEGGKTYSECQRFLILLFIGTASQIQLRIATLCQELGNVTLGEMAQRARQAGIERRNYEQKG